MRMSKDVSFSQGRSLRNQSSITSICNPVQCLTVFSPVSLKMVRTVLQTDQTREMDTVPSSRSAKASTSDQVEISRPITDRRVPRARAERHHQAHVSIPLREKQESEQFEKPPMAITNSRWHWRMLVRWMYDELLNSNLMSADTTRRDSEEARFEGRKNLPMRTARSRAHSSTAANGATLESPFSAESIKQ